MEENEYELDNIQSRLMLHEENFWEAFQYELYDQIFDDSNDEQCLQ